jgi:hypothetical protein
MARISEDELDDIRARNPIVDVASGYTKLRRSGGKLLGPCPMCGGKVSSGRFEVFEKDQSWACYAFCNTGGDVISLVQQVEGCDFRAAIERLGGRAAIDPARAKQLFEERERKRLAGEANSAKFREAERKRLFRTWKSGVEIHGTVVDRYLAGRGLDLPDRCPGLRYLPSVKYFHGDLVDDRGRKSPREIHCGPAMLAAFIRADGKFGGLHTTWLEPTETPAKAELLDPATGEVLPSKKMRGSKIGAHIAIVPVEEPKRLAIGEGIETVLSVWTAMRREGRDAAGMAFWAAGDLGNLAGRANQTIAHPTLKRPNNSALRVPDRFPDPDDAGLSIPEQVEELILLGDGDSDRFLTECAMERAARRYAKQGRVIRIAFAPEGADFNDVLKAAA